MLIPVPRKRRRSRRVRPRATVPIPTPPTTLKLVSATYVWDSTYVDLAFDRAIDISGFDAAAFVVQDPVMLWQRLVGDGYVERLAPDAVRISLRITGDATGDVETLTVGTDNGIVATDGGPAWAGVTDLPLPFP